MKKVPPRCDVCASMLESDVEAGDWALDFVAWYSCISSCVIRVRRESASGAVEEVLTLEAPSSCLRRCSRCGGGWFS